MQNPIKLKAVQATFNAAKSVARRYGHIPFPAATALAGLGTLIADGPCTLSGAGMLFSGIVGLMLTATTAPKCRKSLRRTINILTPVVGIAAFAALYPESKILHKHNQAIAVQINAAKKDCHDSKGRVTDIDGKTFCLRPDPTNPTNGTYTYDSRLNPK